MHILLTNDDGIMAPGLLTLKQALEPLAQVTVIAPSRNYSAAGHRKTLHKPLRIDPTLLPDGSSAWVCSGAPSDCVALGLLGFLREPVQLVVSGINPNPNMGQDVTYSGTVTAAMEGVISGVPALAVSTAMQEPGDYVRAGAMAARVAAHILERGLPAGVLLNLNVPPGPVKGLRLTRQGHSHYRDELVTRHDPRGRPYYWIGGAAPAGDASAAGTDYAAFAQGFASLTPLHLDMTAHHLLSALRDWEG